MCVHKRLCYGPHEVMPDGLYYHITLSSALTSYSLLNSVKIFRLSTSKLFTEPSNVILGLHFRVWQVASRLANQPLAQAPSHHSHHRTHPLRSSPWHVTTLCTALLKIPLLIICTKNFPLGVSGFRNLDMHHGKLNKGSSLDLKMPTSMELPTKIIRV